MTKENVPRSRYYDRTNRRLVYIGKAATPEMWDDMWTSDEHAIREALRPGRGTRWITKLTQKYVPPNSGAVLEGGCGLGHNVAALRRAGYLTYGVDYAPRTVAGLKRIAPELPILLADLRALPFDDCSITAYWSLGVIEHFFHGYQVLVSEMARVLRPGGYAFVTFPYMSAFRRFRARHNAYPPFQSEVEPPGFYQFALDAASVTDEFAKYGFVKIYESSMSGFEGIKDEIPMLRTAFNRLNDYSGRSVILRGIRFVIGRAANLRAGHSCILVLQKT